MATLPRKQEYPREQTAGKKSIERAAQSLFPKLDPPLGMDEVQECIKSAFKLAQKDREGNDNPPINDIEELVTLCLKHIKERTDPVIGTILYSTLSTGQLFIMDALPHEIQRYRMNLGYFYQYLIRSLMEKAAKRDHNIIGVFNGKGDADIRARIKTPGFERGLDLYISVKKSGDTESGQDFPKSVSKIETTAINDIDRRSPYLCIQAVATPKGKIFSYERDRGVRTAKESGHPYSYNHETWGPGFLYPYISGLSAIQILREVGRLASDNYFPLYTLKYQKDAAKLLKKEMRKQGIIDKKGKVTIEKLLEYKEVPDKAIKESVEDTQEVGEV